MKVALIGPGIVEIPPKGWGAVESLIWEIASELGERGHEGVIFNTQNLDEVVSDIELGDFDFVHLFYDVFYPIMDEIKKRCPKIVTAISSAYPYVDQFDKHDRDGYTPFFKWAITQKNHYNFALSDKDLDTFKENGAEKNKLLRLGLGAQHKTIGFIGEVEFSDRSLYLAKIEKRKRQWIYQSLVNVDFVGRYTASTSFNKNSENYLGEWTDEEKKSNITKYANLVLLSDGENGTPLVIKEALIAGLGIVCSRYCSYDLDCNLPFVDVIPDDKLDDLEYIQNVIEKNRKTSITIREEIRSYGINNFSWENIVNVYEKDILSFL